MLRVLWELREDPATFRELRARCDEVSPTVLNARLKELRAAGIVEASEEQGYGMTARGKELLTAFVPLLDFASKHRAVLRME